MFLLLLPFVSMVGSIEVFRRVIFTVQEENSTGPVMTEEMALNLTKELFDANTMGDNSTEELLSLDLQIDKKHWLRQPVYQAAIIVPLWLVAACVALFCSPCKTMKTLVTGRVEEKTGTWSAWTWSWWAWGWSWLSPAAWRSWWS